MFHFQKRFALHAKKNFTEPDPRDDLSGLDVARKLLIIFVKRVKKWSWPMLLFNLFFQTILIPVVPSLNFWRILKS